MKNLIVPPSFNNLPKLKKLPVSLKDKYEEVRDNIEGKLSGKVTFKEVVEGVSSVDPYIWTMLNRRLKGLKTTFNIMNKIDEYRSRGLEPTVKDLIRHRPFLIQPLRDQSKHKVYEKGRQVGVSELVLTEELWFLSTHDNVKWVHTFPRERQLLDFSNTRISEALSESPMMLNLIGMPNQITTKKIVNSYLFLRSAWEADLGEGIDVDGVVFDEKDRMKEGIEYAFEESLSASAYGLIRDVSTPTIPNKGVDATFQLSDQNWWHIKCSKCGLKQPVEFENIQQVVSLPDDIPVYPPDSFEYLCRKSRCRGVLDRYTPGEWVPQFPDRIYGIRGYWMPQLIAPWISATDIMQKKKRYKFKQVFENYVLGKASLGDSVLVSRKDFESLQVNYKYPIPYRTSDFNAISVGIDWGGSNWIVIIGRNVHNGLNYLMNVFHIDDTSIPLESARDIAHVIAPYNPDIIIGDAGYGKDRNEYLYRIYQNEMYFCLYNPAGQKRATSLVPSFSDKTRKCLVDKTLSIKVTCREFRSGTIGIPIIEKNREVERLTEHFENLAPVRYEEEGDIWEVIENKGPDHYAHAFNYALLGQAHFLGSDQFDFGFF